MIKYLRGIIARDRSAQQELENYLSNVSAITVYMHEAFNAYLAGDRERFLTLLQSIDALENSMDMQRRSVEMLIYGNALLPDTRGDILGLVENLDKIANQIQSVMRELELQNVSVPESLHEPLASLAHKGVEIVEVLIQGVRAFLNRPYEVKDIVKEIPRMEHESDVIEYRAVTLTFDDMTLELAHKMQLRQLLESLGSVCDIAEDVGDRLMICAIKRLL